MKVFHGKRELHKFAVSIFDKIHTIYERLLAIDRTAMKAYYEMRLLYPMGWLRRLDAHINDTFIGQRIPDGARLVLVGKKSFTWD